MRTKLSIMAALLAIPLTAATVPAAKTHNVAKTASVPNAWAPETLSGKIVTVDPNHNLMVVKTTDGVPFDMEVTARTHIKSGNQSMPFQDLTKDIDKQVSISFVPERRGDVAKDIRIGG